MMPTQLMTTSMPSRRGNQTCLPVSRAKSALIRRNRGRPGLAGYWGVLFERYVSRILDRRKVAPTLAAAAGATAVACFVDYKITPHRLRPGYEMRLSRPALLLVYGAFGAGLAAGAWWLRRR